MLEKYWKNINTAILKKWPYLGVFAGVSISNVSEQKFDLMGLDPGGLPQGCDIALGKLELFSNLRNMLRAPMLQHENTYANYSAESCVEAILGFSWFFSHWAMPTALKSRVFSTDSLKSGMNHLHAVKTEGQERFSITEELKEPPHQTKLEFSFVEKSFNS